MNRSPRVLLIGRHFWPHGSVDSAGYLMQLATGLQRRGLDVSVLTPRYASSWAHRFTYRDVKVHRPVAAPRGDWSIGRYVRHTTSWLKEHAESFDVLLTDSAREEAIAAIEAARTVAGRVIVRVAGWDQGDPQWWQTSRAARRCMGYVKLADWIVISNPNAHRDLLNAGFDPARIDRIDPGFYGTITRSESRRRLARRTLGAVNADLDVPDDVRVVVCVGRMTRDSAMQLLAKSVRPLCERYKDLHFWFVGDGPYRESLYEYLRSDGVRSSIAMPGSFSDIDDVLAAADLFVQCDSQGLDYLLPAAIGAELPLVIVDNESTRQLIDPPPSSDDPRSGGRFSDPAERSGAGSPSAGRCVHWFGDSSATSLRAAIRDSLGQWEQSKSDAASLRRMLVRHRPLDQAIDQYARLIEEVMVRRGQVATSFGAVS